MMIIVLKRDADPQKVEQLAKNLEAQGLIIQDIVGASTHMIGLAGDTTHLNREQIEANDFVETVMKVSEPYKLAGRKFHPQDTVVEVGGCKIGGGNFVVMAGPCSVESEEQILSIARDVAASGASFLRGGAFNLHAHHGRQHFLQHRRQAGYGCLARHLGGDRRRHLTRCRQG